MAYVIEFCDDTNKFVMGGVSESLIGVHLLDIACDEGFVQEDVEHALSESHLIHILQSFGVDIKLINCDW